MKDMKSNFSNNINYLYNSNNKKNLTKFSKNNNINSMKFKYIIRLNNEKLYNQFIVKLILLMEDWLLIIWIL